jgi:hypothetical protein
MGGGLVSVLVLRGDAAHLPLPDGSVDLIVTSPPYWALRAYTDNGEHYEGQIGSEETWQEYLEALWRCTAEWARVLKPEGSMFVDLGDKYDSGTTASRVNPGTVKDGTGQGWNQGTPRVSTGRPKSLLLLPERYRIGCVDQLGLIAREVIEWHKPNPIPESARDRCGRTHEDIVHLVKQPRYYSAVDEIREPQDSIGERHGGNRSGYARATADIARHFSERALNPLGKVPGSVWTIPSAPLLVPDRIAHARCCGGRKRPGCVDGLAHYAAFPPSLITPIILGWCPSGICIACGEGRFPVVTRTKEVRYGDGRHRPGTQQIREGADVTGYAQVAKWNTKATITGYACSCTPFTGHPGTGKPTRRRDHNSDQPDHHPQGTYGQKQAGEYERVGPWREYHLGRWTPPPTRAAIVLDPFGGTGCAALVADVLGRTGVTVDRSADYCRLARWRTTDPGERARALGVPKPPPVPQGQLTFDELEAI